MTKGSYKHFPDFYITWHKEHGAAATANTLAAVELLQSSGYDLHNGPSILLAASELERLYAVIDEAGLSTVTL
ncbi:hypothetical protein [Microvirga sp. VF16]|uniref:hypothetical protein n=1 Tax=Microvirga sp. VF16 TaxID=2807101 RepID=UPI00193D7415|nr:hypothetical protein [Microvirga sp. VF16]QRM29557.1 hypothetical protein JO965_00540 [Microvirga sp. VF16]